tara:strand:+ start:1547 stop:1762 length:216 start_codon:yes stop_codon:yes gene_type:complete
MEEANQITSPPENAEVERITIMLLEGMTNVKIQEFYDNGNIRVIVNFPQGDSGPVYQYEGIIVPTNTIGGE